MTAYLLDTFCWLELLLGGPKTPKVKQLLSKPGAKILVSSITLAEVAAKFHAVERSADAHHALAAIASRTTVVEITLAVANKAGELWKKHHARSNVGLADCIIAASAQLNEATIVSGDQHFSLFENAIVL